MAAQGRETESRVIDRGERKERQRDRETEVERDREREAESAASDAGLCSSGIGALTHSKWKWQHSDL